MRSPWFNAQSGSNGRAVTLLQKRNTARDAWKARTVPGDCTDGEETADQTKKSHKRGADRGKSSQRTTHPTEEERLPSPGERGRRYGNGMEQRRRNDHEAPPTGGGAFQWCHEGD